MAISRQRRLRLDVADPPHGGGMALVITVGCEVEDAEEQCIR